MNIGDNFISIAQFSNRLGIHYNTARKWVKSGKVNAVNIGSGKRKHWRINKSEIERLFFYDVDSCIQKHLDLDDKEEFENLINSLE